MQVRKDFDKLVRNAKMFNEPGSEIYQTALLIEDIVNKQYTPSKSVDVSKLFARVKANDPIKLDKLLVANFEINANYKVSICAECEEWTILHAASYFGSIDVINYLLDRSNIEIDCKDPEYEGTPLAWACFNGQFEAAKTLIRRGANTLATNGDHLTPVDLVPNLNQKWLDLFKEANGKNNVNYYQEILEKLVDFKLDDEYPSRWFMEVPDVKKYPEYYKIIKNPTSFEEISKNVKSFESFADFNKAIRLVFENAMFFNEEESEIHQDAAALQNYYEELIDNHRMKEQVEPSIKSSIFPHSKTLKSMSIFNRKAMIAEVICGPPHAASICLPFMEHINIQLSPSSIKYSLFLNQQKISSFSKVTFRRGLNTFEVFCGSNLEFILFLTLN